MTAVGPSRWFFDLWSQVYDLSWVQRAAYWPVHEAVIESLREHTPKRLLDVGCGTGQLGGRISATFPGVHVVGCDFSAGMLDQAAARGSAAMLVRGDAMKLPFADGVFDSIVCTEAFHWFPDQARALTEFYRVLAPGGRLSLALVSTVSPIISEVFHFTSRLLGEPLYWPSTGELRSRVEAAGFRVEGQHRIFRWPGALLLPPILTSAQRPPASTRRPRRVRRV